MIDGKRTHLGYFDDEEAAARAYDEAAAGLGRPGNFPAGGVRTAVKSALGGSSNFKGVSWNETKSKWRAQIMMDDKRTHLGYFNDEDAAARAYDEAAARAGRPGNFPAADGVGRAPFRVAVVHGARHTSRA